MKFLFLWIYFVDSNYYYILVQVTTRLKLLMTDDVGEDDKSFLLKYLAAAGAEILLGTWVPVSYYFISDEEWVLTSQYQFTWLFVCGLSESFMLCMYSGPSIVIHLLTVNHCCRLWIFLSPAYDVGNLMNHACMTLNTTIDFIC